MKIVVTDKAVGNKSFQSIYTKRTINTSFDFGKQNQVRMNSDTWWKISPNAYNLSKKQQRNPRHRGGYILLALLKQIVLRICACKNNLALLPIILQIFNF
jgi:uncharacterized membrane protein YfhO